MWESIVAYATEWAVSKTKTFWIDLGVLALVFCFGGCAGCSCERHRPHWFFSESHSEDGPLLQDFRGHWGPVPDGWQHAQLAQRIEERPLTARPCECNVLFAPHQPAGEWRSVGDWWDDQDYWVGTERVMRYSPDEDAARMWIGADLSPASYRWDYGLKRWVPVAAVLDESPEPPLADPAK